MSRTVCIPNLSHFTSKKHTMKCLPTQNKTRGEGGGRGVGGGVVETWRRAKVETGNLNTKTAMVISRKELQFKFENM